MTSRPAARIRPDHAPPSPVRLERDGALVKIVLAHGHTGNAFDLGFVRALRDAVAQLVRWTGEPDSEKVGAVLLRAEGLNFSVGGDLRAFVAEQDAVGRYVREVADTAHEAVLGLAGLYVPMVAGVQGAVAGGAVGFTLTADLVVAARGAKVRLGYTALGLTPDCGASWLLPRLLGERRALDLLLTNRVLPAAEAEAWGLVNRVVDDAELPSAAGALARSLADGHGLALSRAKLLVRGDRLDGLRDHLECEAEFIAAAGSRPRTRRAMENFLSGTRSEEERRAR
ncbi:enoyl-CoA hydratase/isomerase family protein [Streptomyces endocoffeicus]|uniref:enoyl-CoA hydratase/isomerase family protein n=1 Tax=Streptomyces endocoffeicus TaxID=2898945 RepID=UPI0027DB794C|nr:enoyl-CoA hydratase/isomerase family protein [Streptomyces endocoffeicus]